MASRLIFECPSCGTRHNTRRWDQVSRWECFHCHGMYVSTGLMANYCEKEFVDGFARAWPGGTGTNRLCPICDRGMVRFTAGKDTQLEGCRVCHFVWFDPARETEFLRKSPFVKPEFRHFSPEDLPKAFGGLSRDDPRFGGPGEQVWIGLAFLMAAAAVGLLIRYWLHG